MRRIMGMAIVALGAFATAPAELRAGDDTNVLPGPINSIADLQDTAKLVFKLADTNNDDQISQKEATDAGNLIVGGFFFRADVNGDGVLTQQEAEQARETLFAQQPLLRFVLDRAKPTTGAQPDQVQNSQPAAAGTANDPRRLAQSLAADPLRTITNLLDTNHDQKIEATELRQAVQMGVTALFMVSDSNQDGQLSPYELNAAIGEVAKSVVQTAFQAADADRNNMLSLDEYDKALIEPAHAVFRVLDANRDNQLTLAELQKAQQIIQDQIERLRVPDAPNSITNQVRPTNAQGQRPGYPAAPAATAPVASPRQ